eukprot:TRINITY_DN5592_c0_g1_i1.p1 TRINITY_DN5592_c0_g1~~TRINITY_DN5592_c0_g1_i1.p1  ORF type:complete len:349 (+),score=116.91 TRINITY_DN5592_c0_g1_i1:449-1495(+)
MKLVGFRDDVVHQSWLNINLSPTIQNVRPLDYIVLYPIGLLLKRTIENLKEGATHSGYLTKYSVKENKTTGKKKRYCIFKDNFIFYFKTDKNGTEPSGLFMVDYYTIKRGQNKKLFELTFQLSALDTFLPKSTVHTTYVLGAKDEQQMEKWNFECLAHSANGISNKKIAIATSDFVSTTQTMLSFQKGNVLIVLSDRDTNGSYVCRMAGKEGSVNESLITFDQDFAPPPAFGPNKEKTPGNNNIVRTLPPNPQNNNNQFYTIRPNNNLNNLNNVPPPITNNNNMNVNVPPPINNSNPNPPPPRSTNNNNNSTNVNDLLRRIEELERRLNEEVEERRKLEQFIKSRLDY